MLDTPVRLCQAQIDGDGPLLHGYFGVCNGGVGFDAEIAAAIGTPVGHLLCGWRLWFAPSRTWNTAGPLGQMMFSNQAMEDCSSGNLAKQFNDGHACSIGPTRGFFHV